MLLSLSLTIVFLVKCFETTKRWKRPYSVEAELNGIDIKLYKLCIISYTLYILSNVPGMCQIHYNTIFFFRYKFEWASKCSGMNIVFQIVLILPLNQCVQYCRCHKLLKYLHPCRYLSNYEKHQVFSGYFLQILFVYHL